MSVLRVRGLSAPTTTYPGPSHAPATHHTANLTSLLPLTVHPRCTALPVTKSRGCARIRPTHCRITGATTHPNARLCHSTATCARGMLLERDVIRCPLCVQIGTARGSVSGLQSALSERLMPAPLSVNRLGSGLVGSSRQGGECFQRSQVQILPPLPTRPGIMCDPGPEARVNLDRGSRDAPSPDKSRAPACGQRTKAFDVTSTGDPDGDAQPRCSCRAKPQRDLIGSGHCGATSAAATCRSSTIRA
jgi:hypothetical protein